LWVGSLLPFRAAYPRRFADACVLPGLVLHLSETNGTIFPWLLGSQAAEQYFRTLRTSAHKGTSFPNMTMKDLILAAKKITKMRTIEASSVGEKKRYGDKYLLATRDHPGFACHEITAEDIAAIIDEAYALAVGDIRKLGMEPVQSSGELIPNPRQRKKARPQEPIAAPDIIAPHREEEHPNNITMPDGSTINKHVLVRRMTKTMVEREKASKDRTRRVMGEDWLQAFDRFPDEDDESDAESSEEEEIAD
jgi:hypothetical protein